MKWILLNIRGIMGEAFLRFPIMWCYNKSEIKQYLYGKNCFFLSAKP